MWKVEYEQSIVRQIARRITDASFFKDTFLIARNQAEALYSYACELEAQLSERQRRFNQSYSNCCNVIKDLQQYIDKANSQAQSALASISVSSTSKDSQDIARENARNEHYSLMAQSAQQEAAYYINKQRPYLELAPRMEGYLDSLNPYIEQVNQWKSEIKDLSDKIFDMEHKVKDRCNEIAKVLYRLVDNMKEDYGSYARIKDGTSTIFAFKLQIANIHDQLDESMKEINKTKEKASENWQDNVSEYTFAKIEETNVLLSNQGAALSKLEQELEKLKTVISQYENIEIE